MAQQQKSNVTFRGRHVRLMRDVSKVCESQGVARPRILSFGCSTGAECLDLAAVMPEAAVFGCDIDVKAVAAAREVCEGIATIFESGSDALRAAGPFDAVLALNVFCRHPKAAGLDDVSGVYPFASFDEGLATVDSVVKPGGAFALYNGQYFFEDAAIARDYRPQPDGEQDRNGWIEKALPDGSRITDCFYTFEGKTYARKDWTTWLRQDDNQRRAMVDGADHVAYRHVWIDPAMSEGRSTRNALWVKRSG